MNNIFQKYIEEKKAGYKISNSHFRLGSKIHIEDFYYAKHFFQNSYYASRMAFLIAKKIIDDKSCNDKIKKEGITLIGYGLYSSLLMSMVEYFLTQHWKNTSINHNYYSDINELKLVKDAKINKNAIIIVPLSSTFSSSIKLEKALISESSDKFVEDSSPQNLNIIKPHITGIYIYHSHENDDNDNLAEIEKNFGWKKKNSANRTISVQIFFPSSNNGNVIPQYYCIKVPTKWHDIDSCQWCFDNEEKVVFSTDKTSVTPSLIFGFPEGRIIDIQNEYELNPETIDFGHHISNDNHYHYCLRIQKLIEDNNDRIKEWLRKIKDNDIFKDIHDKPILMIAPTNETNPSFLTIVNEYLFNNAATIIHYNYREEYLQNFQKFHQQQIQQEKVNIFFVDDTITTGSTFLKTNYFLKLTTEGNTAFKAAIVLLDRSSKYVNKNVTRKLEKGKDSLFTFANISLPLLDELKKECPICIIEKRYKKIAKSSSLDIIKRHFLMKMKDTSNKRTSNNIPDDPNKYLNRIYIIHKIYQYFRIKDNKNKFEGINYNAWKQDILKLRGPFINNQLQTEIKDSKLNPIDIALLKVLTHSPFINYKNLKSNTFKWIKEKIYSFEKNEQHTSTTLRDFKFLIKRASLLNSNYIFSKDVLTLIQKIYINKINHISDEELYNFSVFYVAQIKNILYQNETKSITVEKNIKFIVNNVKNTPQFKQLLRMIQVENISLIKSFWVLFNQFKETGDQSKTTENTTDDELNIIKKYLQINSIQNHYQYITLNKLFKECNITNAADNVAFLCYLKLMCFFKYDSHDTTSDLKQKTNKFIKYLINLIAECTREKSTKEIGAFFIVKYKNNKNKTDNFLASSLPPNDDKLLAIYNPQDEEYIKKFLNGESCCEKDTKSNKSIIELSYHKNKWKDLYTLDETNDVMV